MLRNEAALIGGCLGALRDSRWDRADDVHFVVVANGCQDDTAERARGHADDFERKGWRLTVIERAEGGKLAALNAGDAVTQDGIRVYIDADVTVAPGLLTALADALETDRPRFASGQPVIVAQGRISRAYARIWRRVPFMTHGVPGCGVYAVNAAGRRRWAAFPDIISDDTFVRLNFAADERSLVAAPYRWPIAEGLGNLVRVRRRQDAGVAEIAAKYPALMRNDDKPPFPAFDKIRLALRDPAGFAVYSVVALASRVGDGAEGWSRGR